MKLLFSFVTTLILFFQNADLESVRERYSTANQSKQNAESFAKMVEKTSSSDIVFKGYKAASEIVSAKFLKGNDRKTTISNGIKSLENNINANPDNTELRLIRLSIQENLPKIIKYNTKINEDKNFILKNYEKQNNSTKNYIKEFAKTSKSMTSSEKASLK